MSEDPITGAQWHVFVCDACGEVIEDPSAVRLLRDGNLIPEDLSVCHVHARCATAFERRRGGYWEEYGLQTPAAGWFLPVIHVRQPALSRPPVMRMPNGVEPKPSRPVRF